MRRTSAPQTIPLAPRNASLTTRLNLGIRDLGAGAGAWRTWMYLAIRDVRRQYSRTYLGPWWLVVQDAAFIAGVGLLWGPLFGTSSRIYVVHFALGLIFFNFISNLTTQGSTVFVASGALANRVAGPMSTMAYQLLASIAIRLAHTLSIVVVLGIAGWVNLGIGVIAALCGVAVIAINGFFGCLWLGVVATRFRDVVPIVESFMRLAFFMTPVLWQADTLLHSGRASFVQWNPFYYLLEIVRAPLTGHVVPAHTIGVLGLMTVLNLVLGVVAFSLVRSDLPYWSSR